MRRGTGIDWNICLHGWLWVNIPVPWSVRPPPKKSMEPENTPLRKGETFTKPHFFGFQLLVFGCKCGDKYSSPSNAWFWNSAFRNWLHCRNGFRWIQPLRDSSYRWGGGAIWDPLLVLGTAVTLRVEISLRFSRLKGPWWLPRLQGGSIFRSMGIPCQIGPETCHSSFKNTPKILDRYQTCISGY